MDFSKLELLDAESELPADLCKDKIEGIRVFVAKPVQQFKIKDRNNNTLEKIIEYVYEDYFILGSLTQGDRAYLDEEVIEIQYFRGILNF